jgi:hypothetical protein
LKEQRDAENSKGKSKAKEKEPIEPLAPQPVPP